MSHSLTTYRSQHVDFNDIDLIVFAELLMDTFRREGELPATIAAMCDAWSEALSFSGAGAIDLALDEHLADDATCRFVCAALVSLRARLHAAAAAGASYSAAELEALVRGRVTFTGERPAADLEPLCARFCLLLECDRA